MLGAGHVGVEFAQMFRRSGKDVTVGQRGRQVLSREDADIAEAVMEILRGVGIGIVLNAEAAGIEMDRRGYTAVNERLKTNVPGTYALGDVNGGPAFTHVSYDDSRVVRENLLHGGDATTGDRTSTDTAFIDPPLGRVGMNDGMAREQGHDFRVAKMPMSHMARVGVGRITRRDDGPG